MSVIITGLTKTYPSEEIISDRIVLRRHAYSAADTMFSYIDRDRARLRIFLPWVDSTLNLHDTQEYILSSEDKWRFHEIFDFGIFRKSDQLYLGNVGAHGISWSNRTIEIGYWILGDFESQGFMTEAVLALEKELFRIGFHRIEIRCSSENERSARVPKRAGYTLEATFKDQAIENGRYRDTLVFSKLGK